MLGEGAGNILESLCPCVRLFECLSDGFVQKVSPEQLNLVYPNLVW